MTTSVVVQTAEAEHSTSSFTDISKPASIFHPRRTSKDDPLTSQNVIEQMTLDESEPHDGRAVSAKESWNRPRINVARLAAVFLAFFNLGVHDAAYGPLIPPLEQYYGLGYTTVSLVFLATFPGYVLAAISSDRLHLLVGRRGVSGFASTLRIATYIALVCHPPWPVIIVMLVFCGWGNGLLDSAWNAWVSELSSPNELLGLLHSLYGLGADLTPLIAASMIVKAGIPWYRFYLIPLSLAILELASGLLAFWRESATEFRKNNTNSGEARGRTRAALKVRITWVMAIFLLLYVGAEVALSGWVVTFMIRVRNAQQFDSSLTATGFWLGITVGRLVLGFVTPKIGEKWAVVIYLLLAMAWELVFWLVPTFVVSAVAVALLGFFLGPMFPVAVVVLTKLLPKHLHVGAISFVAAVGMGGAAVLPFAVGAIASAAGVKVLQPIILAILAVLLALWITLPKVPKEEHKD